MGDILVTENITGPGIEALKAQFQVEYNPELWKSPMAIEKKLGVYKAVIVRNQTMITRELIFAAPGLKVIGRAGAGLDNIDVAAATEAGIPVVYTPEQNSISVAELTIGMMLCLARKIGQADRDTKAGNWNRHQFTGVELYGKTFGIVGIGRIGYRTACRARTFGMDIIAHDEYANPDGIVVSELRAPLLSLSELLAKSDFVSCHLPLTSETECLFDYTKFCMMKPSAYFVNTSRGAVVDEKGLIQALEEGKIAGAALDVRQKEPPVSDALFTMKNVILTPHIAAFTQEGQNRVVSSVCQDVAALLNGRAAKNFANFPVSKKK